MTERRAIAFASSQPTPKSIPCDSMPLILAGGQIRHDHYLQSPQLRRGVALRQGAHHAPSLPSQIHRELEEPVRTGYRLSPDNLRPEARSA